MDELKQMIPAEATAAYIAVATLVRKDGLIEDGGAELLLLVLAMLVVINALHARLRLKQSIWATMASVLVLILWSLSYDVDLVASQVNVWLPTSVGCRVWLPVMTIILSTALALFPARKLQGKSVR